MDRFEVLEDKTQYKSNLNLHSSMDRFEGAHQQLSDTMAQIFTFQYG